MQRACRLAQRWDLTNGTSVEQTECDLKHLWPETCWNALHLRLIYFGRGPCQAKGHDPAECPICSWAAVPPFDRSAFLHWLGSALMGRNMCHISDTQPLDLHL